MAHAPLGDGSPRRPTECEIGSMSAQLGLLYRGETKREKHRGLLAGGRGHRGAGYSLFCLTRSQQHFTAECLDLPAVPFLDHTITEKWGEGSRYQSGEMRHDSGLVAQNGHL